MIISAPFTQAQQSITQQATNLIQRSYANPQAQKLVQKFMKRHSYYNAEQFTTIPSVGEILFAINLLQDSYGFIEDQQIRYEILDVLRATITATNNAVEKVKNKTSNGQNLSDIDAKIIENVMHQNKLLRVEFSRIKHRSLQSYITAPSTWYMIASAIALISLGSLVYYYNFPADSDACSFVLTPEQEHQVEQNIGHQRARDILAKIALSKEKINPQDYLQAAHEIIPQLDATLDKSLKYLIQTFINIQEGGFFEKGMAKIEARKHQDLLKQTYAHTLNSDPAIRAQAPDGVMWQPQDINVMRLVK